MMRAKRQSDFKLIFFLQVVFKLVLRRKDSLYQMHDNLSVHSLILSKVRLTKIQFTIKVLYRVFKTYLLNCPFSRSKICSMIDEKTSGWNVTKPYTIKIKHIQWSFCWVRTFEPTNTVFKMHLLNTNLRPNTFIFRLVQCAYSSWGWLC